MYRVTGLILLFLCVGCMKFIGAPPENAIQSGPSQPGSEVFNDEEVLRKTLISLRKKDQAEQAARIEQAASGQQPQANAVVEKVTAEVEPIKVVSEQSESVSNQPLQGATQVETDKTTAASKAQAELLSEQLWVRVPFKSGFTTLDKKMVKALTDVAGKYLAEPREQTLVIRGFCDGEPIGGYGGGKHKSRHGYNTQLALSQSRARYVADIMIKAGIQAEAVKVEGYGDTHFIADNKTAEGRDKNRRVDVFLLGK